MSIVIVFLFSLMIPFLAKPINGLYDVDELTGLKAYCFLHADRPNPIDDLIDKGFLSSSFRGENCLSHPILMSNIFEYYKEL